MQTCLVDNQLHTINDYSKEEWKKKTAICRKCKSVLVVRIGKIRAPHFSHPFGSLCSYSGNESVLHSQVKELIASGSIEIMLPPVSERLIKTGIEYYVKDNVILGERVIPDPICFIPDNAMCEYDLGSFRPDVLVEHGGKKYIIEILVTHAVDEEKRKRIEDIGIPAIEFDFSSYDPNKELPEEELCKIISKEVKNKKWIYNPEKDSFSMILSGCNQRFSIGSEISRYGILRDISGNSAQLKVPCKNWTNPKTTYVSSVHDCKKCNLCVGLLFYGENKGVHGVLCSLIDNKDPKPKYLRTPNSFVDNEYLINVEINKTSFPYEKCKQEVFLRLADILKGDKHKDSIIRVYDMYFEKEWKEHIENGKKLYSNDYMDSILSNIDPNGYSFEDWVYQSISKAREEGKKLNKYHKRLGWVGITPLLYEYAKPIWAQLRGGRR